jgi:hypothetical protein
MLTVAQMEQVREMALKNLRERRVANSSGRHKIENGALHAGSDMYFYCESCNALADVKPETYLFDVRKLCSECEGLLKAGWLCQ